ncbi:MAG TPA: HNH endonuclease [Saprospiraceae bacterium]|nr:HNH endonuclease [Saprospiraceae bacterium]HMQ84170.1 HNH endonuclease [Saprospiraceae bacterium]
MQDKIKNYPNEKWATVDFGGPTKKCDYEISNYGRIKSVDKITGFEKPLKGAQARGGLFMLNQKLKDGSTGIVYIHRFVAENFVERKDDEKEYIIHLDFDKTNNKWTNLAWATPEEWKIHGRKNPNRKPRTVRTKNFKLTESQVRVMKRMLQRGKTKRSIIARSFGVSENCVYKIDKGLRWAHVQAAEEGEEA